MTEAKKRKLDDSWLEDEVVIVTGNVTNQVEPKLGSVGDAQVFSYDLFFFFLNQNIFQNS